MLEHLPTSSNFYQESVETQENKASKELEMAPLWRIN